MSCKILDGAMGSELIRRGMILPHHIWSADANLSNPELVYQIHKDYIDAGADFITANTFRTTPRAFAKAESRKKETGERRQRKGNSNQFCEEAEINAKASLSSAMRLAKKAAGRNIPVIGSIAPLEDCYLPELFPGKTKAKKEFLHLGNLLVAAGADILILETMNSIQETFAGLLALQPLHVPIWMSFVLKDDNHLLSGEPLVEAIRLLESFEVEMMLLNCNSISRTEKAVEKIVDNWQGQWGVYPNLGTGEPSPDGDIQKRESMQLYLQLIEKVIAMGASVVGGCCGSSPEHIQNIQTLNFAKKGR
ncbi:MAG: homocysteine S-methyltransferase family protein [Candidatus Marinimicrobia bacterium]|nr:homocysteine S-methyltransferase family protein [Candidatus Neomarinimicrobiota bacterium]